MNCDRIRHITFAYAPTTILVQVDSVNQYRSSPRKPVKLFYLGCLYNSKYCSLPLLYILAEKPIVTIKEGEELRVPPLTPFKIVCDVSGGDPPPKVAWHSRGRPVNAPQPLKTVTLEHGGLYEGTTFACVGSY
jgi:hypothetical protein